MRKAVLFLGAVFLAFSINAWCQDTANIVGTVTDSTGAVIANAKVIVSNPDRGFTRELKTESTGYYSLSAVPIGNYVVTAEAPGFQKLVRSGITLQVGQTARVDMQLTVGQVTEQVNVTGNVARVETTKATVSSVITNTQIQNLDLNGRNWVSLALLVPGASPDNGLNTTDVGVNGNNSISFNGNRLQYANWEIDGGNNTDEGSASTFNTYPSLDTIAEFRISTSTYGADMGKHAGANIELATKGGTRTFHGSAYEYVRNDKFDAASFFDNRACLHSDPSCVNGAPKPPYKWNDFGYTFGGPFYIPGHYNTDKTKTFFFWSQEWKRLRKSSTIDNGVPTALERNGDFSQCDPTSTNYNAVVANSCDLPSLGGTTYDTVQAMPGFNASDFAVAQGLLGGLIPLPNSGLVTYHANASAPTNWRQEQIRVDQNIGANTTAFFRMTKDAWNTVTVPSLWTGASYDTIKTEFGGPGVSMVFHITHTFRPTLMNEFVAAYTTDHIILIPKPGSSSVAGSINRPSGFTMGHFFAANGSNPLLPDLTIDGGTGFNMYESAGNTPWYNSNPIVTWKDNLSWVHGNHTTKMGFYLENYRKNEQFGSVTQGALTFDVSQANTTGNALADMLLGRISSYSEGTQVVSGVAVGGYPKGHWQMTDFEPYINDDWKVTPRLTLNLGVRYYIYSRIHDVSHPIIDTNFLPNQYVAANAAQLDADGNLIPGSGANWTNYGNGMVQCGVGGMPAGCQLANTWGNIAPRFGFAWDPFGNGTTSIRGGYGIYYESGNGNEAQAEGGEGNPPVAPNPSAGNILGYGNFTPTSPLGPTSFTSWPYSQSWPSVQQFSFTVEHEFSKNTMASVAYIGALGRHLARSKNINMIAPGVGTLNAPALAGLTGTNAGDPAQGIPGDEGQQLCDAAGNCDVQTTLIYHEALGSSTRNFFAPYRGFTTITPRENTAVSSYNALQASLRHTSHGLTLQAAYTWSHAIDDSTTTYNYGFPDDYHLTRWKGTGDINRTHIFQASYIYEMPFFKDSTNRFAKQALGGWQLSGIASFFTGQPVDFGCGVSGYSTGIGRGVRCNPVGKVQIQKGTFNDPQYGPTPTWWDPSTVTQPLFSQLWANGSAGMFGYMGRNALTGPGRGNFDMALLKNFSLPWARGEHSTLQFRLETFNTFNHPQWNGFNNGCSSNNGFGESCAHNENSPGEVNGTWDPRILQLALKFIF